MPNAQELYAAAPEPALLVLVLEQQPVGHVLWQQQLGQPVPVPLAAPVALLLLVPVVPLLLLLLAVVREQQQQLGRRPGQLCLMKGP